MFKIKGWNPEAMTGPNAGIPASKPMVLGKLIKKAKKPILIVGTEGLLEDINGKPLIDLIIEVGKKGIPICCTAHSSKYFFEKDFKPAMIKTSADITNLVGDPESGYDLAAYICIPYYLVTTLFNHLKNYAYKHLKAICLDRYFHPNATFSLPNLKKEEYKQAIQEIFAEL